MNTERFPLTITESGVSAKIRRFTQVKNGTDYIAYVVEYSLLGKRTREWRSDLTEAKETAVQACRKIADGEHCALQLKNHDRLVYLRATEALIGTGIPLDVAASDFAQALSVLGDRTKLVEAAREYVARHSSALLKIKVREALDKLLEQAKTDRKSEQRQNRLASLLGQFADAFNIHVNELTPKLVGNYLAALPYAERTKANHRDMIGFFSRWCVREGYLPKGTDLLEGVQKYSKRKYGAVEILVPEEMVQLLTHVEDELLPFIALCGFAGLRSIEVQRLDWKDIDFEDGYIEIQEKTAKQHEGEILRRIVPMSANLKAWLLKVRKKSGPVCPFAKVENELEGLCKRSGVTWKHNCLRHSAISYRIAETGDVPRIADESGNSAYVIRKNYLSRRKPWQAAQWFGIMPGEASNIVYLPTAEDAKAKRAASMPQ
jgi:integrase